MNLVLPYLQRLFRSCSDSVLATCGIRPPVEAFENTQSRLGCMKDSAGKLCPDKWTRQGEEGRVGEESHEEVLHEDAKEK